MRKRLLGIVLLVAATQGRIAGAQVSAVPGRDLLSFPIGQIAEAPALPGMLAVGLFNPAGTLLPGGARWRLSVGSMSTPSDVGASAQAVGASTAWRGSTVTVSLARAAVAGLVKTDSDPLTVGNDVAYSTLVASLGAARQVTEHIVVGAALRGRTGRLDLTRRNALSIDVGFVAEHLTRLDLRVGAATFLATPGRAADEPPTWITSADVRVAETDSVHTVRFGVSASATAHRPSEQFMFASARYGAWEIRGGPARTVAYGETNVRLRLGIGLRYFGYVVAIAREESPSGLAPSYQFVLSSLIR